MKKIIMKLVYYCKFCSKEIKITKNASDRVKLNKILSKKSKNITCNNCNKSHIINLNNVYAKHGLLNIIFLLSMITAIILITNYIDTIITKNGEAYESASLYIFGFLIPPIFYFTWLSEENKKIEYFNRIKL